MAEAKVASVLHLTDAHDRFDRRVLSAVAADGADARLEVLTDAPGLADRLAAGLLVLALIAPALAIYGRALSRMGRRRGLSRGHPFFGIKRLVSEVARAIAHVRRHRASIAASRLVHANDQACGLVALMVHRLSGTPYIYDAHEMVPFRNRSYGLVRRCVEALLEGAIARRARRVLVVNRPIRRFYRRFYRLEAVSVRANDFFADRPLSLDADGDPCIVYVGAAGGGRIDTLAATAARLSCRLVMAVDRPEAAAARMEGLPASIAGLDGYEDAVATAASGTAAYMWCHLDASVLSYRFALPNKFFQAMAFGMPVVVAPGTYLARIVAVHGVGMVGDAATLRAGALWDRAHYGERLAAVARLRRRLADTKELL